jgi:GTP-binding protein
VSIAPTLEAAPADPFRFRGRGGLRNVAIVAHVDHGKTTLVDGLLAYSGAMKALAADAPLVMDSNDLERERGITIFSKNCSLVWRGTKINVIDTPGHADFGGQVERVLRMADGICLLVDAFEGPLPQTRFVLRKALARGLEPIVVINKIDRANSRPKEVLDEVYGLFIELGAHDHQLEFPVIYASGRQGRAGFTVEGGPTLAPILDTILAEIPPPRAKLEDPVNLPVCHVQVDNFVGRIAVGRLEGGCVREGDRLKVLHPDGTDTTTAAGKLFVFEGLKRVPAQELLAGDVVAIAGVEDAEIGDTIADPERPVERQEMKIEPPTLAMEFRVNDSPFAGQDGQYVTTRHLKERLDRAQKADVALQVLPTDRTDSMEVRGRGVLHLGILIETMRREGYEFAVGRPRVLFKETPEGLEEPIEQVTVEVPPDDQGKVIELMGRRRGELVHMQTHGDTAFLEFEAPSRGLIGLRTKLMNATRGTAVMSSQLKGYAPHRGELPTRSTGSQVCSETGIVTSYALNALVDRGMFFVEPTEKVYEGQVTGEHRRDEDVLVNPCKRKHLTNIRSAGADEKVDFPPPLHMSIEESLEFLADDELLEVTPKALRMRKRMLKETDRRRELRIARAATQKE